MERYKRYYNKKGRTLSLVAGSTMLIRLPIQKRNEMIYEVMVNATRKVYHINTLKIARERVPMVTTNYATRDASYGEC